MGKGREKRRRRENKERRRNERKDMRARLQAGRLIGVDLGLPGGDYSVELHLPVVPMDEKEAG